MIAKNSVEDLIIPDHVAVIMDGNGRWAKKRGQPRQMGHIKGAKTFKKMTTYAKECGVKYITFYAFSTENWKRPQEEVDGIMNLFENYLDDVKKYIKENIRIIFIGDRTKLRESLQIKMNNIEEDSKDFDGMTLLLAINYGGRDEIVNSVKTLAKKVSCGEISADDITDTMINDNLYTKNIPDVDLVIRPSGEERLSNFLIWQTAYAEFYFTSVLWPDFGKRDFDKALLSYSKRNRRFGGVKA